MTFSWNLAADIRDMWSLPFMVNGFRAGAIVAVTAGVIGWFVVLRKETFAAHTISVVGFPGAACALWLGLPVGFGYFGFSVLASLVIAAASRRSGRAAPDTAAIVGATQAFALAAGGLFLALFGGFLGSASALLFGTFLGITTGQVVELAVVCAASLTLIAATGRRLLFASVDPDVARVAGAPARFVQILFLVLLGAVTAEISQITGSLLVFALLVLPPATAAQITDRIWLNVTLSVTFALVAVWLALCIAFYTPYPIGFWLTTVTFAGYLTARGLANLRPRATAAAGS